MNTFDLYPNFLLSLAIWREGRGEPREGKVAIKHVILNRAAHPKGPFAKCPDVVTNVLAPFHLSAFNPADPNSSRLPTPKAPADWAAWRECCEVVDEDQPDPTGGANYYFAAGSATPRWADPSKLTCAIGRHWFYRI